MVYSQFLQYQIKKQMSLCVLNPDSDSPFGYVRFGISFELLLIYVHVFCSFLVAFFEVVQLFFKVICLKTSIL